MGCLNQKLRLSLTIILFIAISNLSFSQTLQKVIGIELKNDASNIGLVKPFEDLGGIPTIFSMHKIGVRTDSSITILSELNLGGVLNVANTYNLNGILSDKEQLLQQIVKDGIWHVLGYEKLDSTTGRYFVKQLDVNNGSVKFVGNTIQSDVLTVHATPFIARGNVLDDKRIAFCGNKGHGKSFESLFLIFDEGKQELVEIETINIPQGGGEYFLHKAFITNDTLYAHYSVEFRQDDDVILVYDKDYTFIESRPLSESINAKGDINYSFGLDFSLTRWNDKLYFTGRASRRNQEPEDIYLQEYSSELNLLYDERYFTNDFELAPYYNSMVPLSKDYAVIISFGFGSFGSPGGRNLYLRLFESNTRATQLTSFENENFTHFDNAIDYNKKLLLSGYSLDSTSNKSNLAFYLIDYNNTIVGINENSNSANNSTINIYPNPVKINSRQNALNISWDNMNSQNWQINICNLQGKVVYTKSIELGKINQEIILPNTLSKGAYSIHATCKNNKVTGKFIVD